MAAVSTDAPAGAEPAPPRPSVATGQAFDNFTLPEPVREGLRRAGFTHCTPIQEKALPIALAGRDVAGQAQTGTGKTAAFLITLFTRLLERERHGPAGAPRALIIAPTRELVVQIAADATLLGQATPFAIQAVYGGVDYRKQRASVAAGVDVLIGTPGRLIDYHRQRVYDLGRVEVLVVDEADRMFDMGFIKDLRYILRQLPPYQRRQSMLFSATLSYDVMELAYVFMNDAERVSVTPEQVTAENVEHMVYHVALDEKMPLLVGILRGDPAARVLVFVNMRRTAERIERTLALNGVAAAAITGDVDQRRRLSILEDFKAGALPVLVATDVASRGLHIEGVTHVINYDLPLDPEDYVHRIGRTARAGASGKAITLACEDYVQGLEPIEEYIGFKLPFTFPEEAELVRDIRHAPRERRDRGRGPRGEHGDRRQHHEQRPRHGRPTSHAPHGAASHPPAPHAPAPHAATAEQSGAPKRRRRRRGRGGGGGGTPPSAGASR